MNEVFLSTEDYPQAHKVLGVVNATAHLMLPSDAIDSFESLSHNQLKLGTWGQPER